MLTTKNGAPYALLLIALVLCGCTPAGPRELLQGKKCLEKHDYQQAVTKLETATKILRTNAAAWNYLGLAYQFSDRVDDAQRAYVRALSLDRGLSEARYNLGCLYLEHNNLDAAKSALTGYTLEKDQDPEGFLKLGTVLSRLGDYSSAERSFDRVLKLRPESPEALTGLGVVRQKRGRTVEARDFFTRALRADSQYGPALLNYAIVAQHSLRDRPLALRLYEQYLSLKPPQPGSARVASAAATLRSELAVSRQSQTRMPSAPPPERQVQPDGAQSSPSSDTRTGNLSAAKQPGSTAASNRTPQRTQLPPSPKTKSVTEVASVNQAPPTHSEKTGPGKRSSPSRNVASSSFRYSNPAKPEQGNRAEAEKVFGDALEARKANRVSEAEKLYRRAIKLDPAYFQAHFNLALILTELGKLGDAAHSYENALAIEPDSVPARYNFAILLKKMGYPEDSLRQFEILVSSHPNDPRAHIMLGNLFSQQFKQNGKAREHYQKALEIDPANPQAAAIRQWLADPAN